MVYFSYSTQTMAEQLLTENSWSEEVELSLPDGGSPQPIGWEDDVASAVQGDLLSGRHGHEMQEDSNWLLLVKDIRGRIRAVV